MRSKETRKNVLSPGGRLLGMLVLLFLSSLPAWAGGDWNDAKISWQSYEKGMESAKAEKKPVCLVIYTEWCGHCKTYSSVFHDPKVVDQSKSFVMIRVDKDKNAELSKQYALDGQYIPRTYFLSSEGKVNADIQGPNSKFKYFLDEKDPASILSCMSKALSKEGKEKESPSSR